MIDTKELRRLAQAASTGTWRVYEVGVGFEIAAGDNVVAQAQSIPRDSVQHAARRANAAFIAAANPAVVSELLDRLEAAEKERDELRIENERLRAEVAHVKEVEFPRKAQAVADGWRGKCERLEAKITEMERQEPVAWMLNCPTLGGDTGWILSWTQSGAGLCNRLQGEENEKRLYALPGAQPAPNFADAYQGAMEEVAIWKKRALEAEDLNRKFIAGSNGPMLMGEPVAQPAPSVPHGWLRAIDEALVIAHIGVANADDSYEQAREKLANLIGCHVDIATDPAVNGGWKLVPIEPTPLMKTAGIGVEVYQDSPPSSDCLTWEEVEAIYTAMLAAAPEAKP